MTVNVTYNVEQNPEQMVDFGVLLFHAFYQKEVSDRSYHPYVYIDIDTFEELIERLLEQGVHFVDPSRMLDPSAYTEGKNCLLTIDDGYYNNLLAVEVLRKFGIKVLLFPVKHQIVNQKLFWVDVFYDNLIGKQSFEVIYKQIQQYKMWRYEAIVSEFCNDFGLNAFDALDDRIRPFTLSELVELAQDELVEIGVHSVAHDALTVLSKDEVITNLNESKDFLQSVTGTPVEVISYPFGKADSAVIDITRDLGYQVGFTTIPGHNSINLSRSEARLEIKRDSIPVALSQQTHIQQLDEIITSWFGKGSS